MHQDTIIERFLTKSCKKTKMLTFSGVADN